MSSDMNIVMQIGRLTADPVMRYTQSGTAVASFTLASNYSYGSGDNKKEQVLFFDCVAWAKLGEIITEYAKKGHRIAIEGRLSQRKWKDQEDKWHSKVEIVVENFQFLNSKPQACDTPVGSTSDAPDNPLDGKDITGQIDNPFADDDLPF